jgi:hypothetical protein
MSITFAGPIMMETGVRAHSRRYRVHSSTCSLQLLTLFRSSPIRTSRSAEAGACGGAAAAAMHRPPPLTLPCTSQMPMCSRRLVWGEAAGDQQLHKGWHSSQPHLSGPPLAPCSMTAAGPGRGRIKVAACCPAA